jgi:23S rRNA pseudouridine2605 synthase
VNDRTATLGDRVDPARDRVAVDGSRVNVDPSVRYLALHKPAGVVATMRDPQRRRDLTAFVPEGPRVFPVGRLDRDTEGLLLLTNDGELANRLLHPRYGIEKEYLAEVRGAITSTAVRALHAGVPLEDGPARVIRARVVQRLAGRSSVRLVVAEGRKRLVRRMLGALGFPVLRLVRIRVGAVHLGRVPAGASRPLSPEEVAALYRAAGLTEARPEGHRDRPTSRRAEGEVESPRRGPGRVRSRETLNPRRGRRERGPRR